MNFVFMVHIGQKIKLVLEESRIPVTEFAAKINKSRTVVYNIFERKTIDTGLLFKICKVLEHDFFNYYLENVSWVVKESQAAYQSKNDLAALKEELQQYKKDLVELKEKNELLRKINYLLEAKKKKGK